MIHVLVHQSSTNITWLAREIIILVTYSLIFFTDENKKSSYQKYTNVHNILHVIYRQALKLIPFQTNHTRNTNLYNLKKNKP